MAVKSAKRTFDSEEIKKLSNAKRRNKKSETNRIYTRLKPINTMLNQFVEKAYDDFAWISIDGEGFIENCLKQDFMILLKTVLDEAYDQCMKSAPPRRRFFKMRTMHAHKQIFIKIVYSCEGTETYPFTRSILKVKEIIEKNNGYFNVKCADDETSILIALHE